jgi:hypothetical protein
VLIFFVLEFLLYHELSYSSLLDSIQKSEASAVTSQVAQVSVKSRGTGRYPSLEAAAPEGIGGRPCLLRGEQPSHMSALALAKAVNEIFQVHTKQCWNFITYLNSVFNSDTGRCLPPKRLNYERAGA